MAFLYINSANFTEVRRTITYVKSDSKIGIGGLCIGSLRVIFDVDKSFRKSFTSDWTYWTEELETLHQETYIKKIFLSHV